MDMTLPYQGEKFIHTKSLSIVIITRNEAKNVARAIESVLKTVHDIPGTEVLLVDSASTDNTVDIAKRYPIRIVRLRPNWFLSVPAGRHIGMHYTRGEFILHMDGDMALDPEWVSRAFIYMSENPQVGAVGGYYRNVYLKNGIVIGEQDIHRDNFNKTQEVRYVGGAALYRRSAIEKMGGFQPYIKGEEGVYMSLGLRCAGFKVVQLPYLMSQHYCVPPQSLDYNLRRLRLDMWLGFGQIPRYSLGTSMFWTYLQERGAYIIYYLAVIISIITLLASIITKNIIYFSVWIFIVTIFIGLFVIKKRSLSKTLVSLIAHSGIALSALRGFFIRPRSPAEYPLDVDVVQ